MEASLMAALNSDDKLLIAEAGLAELAGLDEEGALNLEERVRRSRDRYVSQYRRAATARVAEHRSRGRARPENAHAAAKVEAFERALARVSHRVAVLARQSAAELRAERIAAAKAAKQKDWPGAGDMVPRPRHEEPTDAPEAVTTGAPRTPASERMRASTLATGARKQARRDSKG